jgi:hypothetical protein
MGTHIEVVVPSMSRTTAPMSEGELISLLACDGGERNEREKSENCKETKESPESSKYKTREALHLGKRTLHAEPWETRYLLILVT